MILVFGLFFAFFLFATGYVAYSTYSLNRKINLVSLESIQVSSKIREDNQAVNKFVLSKSILDYLSVIDSAKFHYKKYLDEVVAVLPPGVTLRTVDFQVKGWVSVSATIPDMGSLRTFEERIKDTSILDQTVFSSVFSEGLVKEKDGNYVIKLQFELKKNA